MKNPINTIFFIVLIMTSISCKQDIRNGKINFNDGWSFLLVDNQNESQQYEMVTYNAESWASVCLPHSAKLEKYVCNDMWQGTCWYRKIFNIPLAFKGKKLILEFEGAMGRSEFWINGIKVKKHQGGYLPVVFDISDYVTYGKENTIAVKLNNTDNPLTGPKPLKKLDFCFYGGLYRNAHLIVKDKVHISHPVIANKIAGGGIFVHTPKVSKAISIVEVKTHISNEHSEPANIQVVHTLKYKNQVIENIASEIIHLDKKNDKELIQQINVQNTQLWSPKHPNLYTLETKLLVNGLETEVTTTNVGIREFKFVDNQLYINGKKTYLRGTNRHQEYPYIGYALSDNAQYRDAYKIKKSGFDYVRLSHYPHSKAFMDACDELGLVVLDAILGWQYYLNDGHFRDYCYNSARQLIRRDRNHPCVLAWEVSLNETHMPSFFMQKLHEIVHEEYPQPNAYSAGWKPGAYDIYLQARQHRLLHLNESINQPYIVSEYGDWEYYSRNAGLNQHNLPKNLRIEKSSRQLRKYGEGRMLQQCYNLQEAYTDNLANTLAFGDGFWVMYDYNSGIHSEHCCSGVMDMNRLRKFSSWFYQSQRSLDEDTVLHIASYWTPESTLDVKVYSNCEEVEMVLNGKSLGQQKPDMDENSFKLSHPPFTFKLDRYEEGKLEAIGSVDGKEITRSIIQSPKKAHKLKIWLDESGKKPEHACNDVLFVYVAATDENGTIVPSCMDEINVLDTKNISILNVDNKKMEAGVATLLVQIGENKEECVIKVDSKTGSGEFRFMPI
ncbi:glycoside hydrolase family 2 protein [Labilibacter marinus]|uniref:glycoside hydrolase family 2 protein n=1 Tax=Labilibacter marinus TaxID=1477105 RepID=UPI00094FB636|nr:glycoside hydrolase family 2 TIM barrel-domain containing protein [Labilibacter marinus]